MRTWNGNDRLERGELALITIVLDAGSNHARLAAGEEF